MIRQLALSLAAAALPATLLAQTPAPAPAPAPADAALRQRLPQDEVIYFVLPDLFQNGDPSNDRGGLSGDRLRTGFDPADKGFYQGGDLAGLTQRLSYLQGLGITAIWLTPIFTNKPVQGPPGRESAGYHGYWITDFTRTDPHLGTNDEFRRFVDAAHALGMKVYMDIIANHTADVIQLQGCDARACSYRSLADYPYSRRLGLGGAAINPGFLGDGVQTADNFARLTDPGAAYTPVVPRAERNVKMPAWLNDPIYYHNRGNSTFQGESSLYGDFSGLDDLYTEHPRVVSGMIDIYGAWIDRFGVDGYRIDTARHVNPEFWQAFVPAMLARARARGIPNFHIFGEVYVDELEPGQTARYTRVDRLPAVLDFAFNAAVRETVAGSRGTDRLARLFAGDALYEGGEAAALQLPTFIGNHDMGRFATAVDRAFPNALESERLARVRLAHSILLLLRGVPTIYYGDEQGFAGDGGDQDAREPMFASRTPSYLDNRQVGTSRTHAQDAFDPAHPLYRHIAELARLRVATTALRRGRQVTRLAGDRPGLFAVSRFDPDSGAEVLIAFNTSAVAAASNVSVEARSTAFTALFGACPAAATAPGSARIEVPAFGAIVCQAVPAR